MDKERTISTPEGVTSESNSEQQKKLSNELPSAIDEIRQERNTEHFKIEDVIHSGKRQKLTQTPRSPVVKQCDDVTQPWYMYRPIC
ncbi:hypothetical protein AHZ32_11850 [Salmonella enterica]|uniref:hypothetical protein n=1 Tax=Salmonella enterica TaxID=28901 RepID=UPI0009AEAFA1|nr:hypothetical protein [Salmonella enterica]EBR3871229.1 hypothetical protein [Salmonella enterica subsp. enterica]ECE0872376.1 hypothetical protein [Salmonella enterica subsp. enterica serovar Abaetetuba]EDZ8425419.1 hypothetical protein [Salmonella enterica subsp. enterica serovar Give]ASA50348.1 hypothetical protein GX95_04065 [Salmonella enterica subsp. enterica serovar Minnesota]EAO9207724.1 hypothetical protein [Salmonella enterica]